MRKFLNIVVDKHGDKLRELHTVGFANDNTAIDTLVQKGHQWIDNHLGIQCFSPQTNDCHLEK
jgi:hypothetical protein